MEILKTNMDGVLLIKPDILKTIVVSMLRPTMRNSMCSMG